MLGGLPPATPPGRADFGARTSSRVGHDASTSLSPYSSPDTKTGSVTISF